MGGAVVFELGLVSAITILVTRRMASRTCMRLALILLIPSLVNQIAPADQRAGVASAYFLVCVIGNSLPEIAVAVLARAFNSLAADGVLAVTLALLALAAFAVSKLQQPQMSA